MQVAIVVLVLISAVIAIVKLVNRRAAHPPWL